MGMVNLWREARGKVLRKRWDQLMQQVERIDDGTWAACSDYIRSGFDSLNKQHSDASGAERKRISKRADKLSQQLVGAGDLPSALGLRIMTMNFAVRDLPGHDAFFVKLASSVMIDASRGISGQVMPLRRGRWRSAKRAYPPWEEKLNEALAAGRLRRIS
jgi:hypothetical protein